MLGDGPLGALPLGAMSPVAKPAEVGAVGAGQNFELPDPSELPPLPPIFDSNDVGFSQASDQEEELPRTDGVVEKMVPNRTSPDDNIALAGRATVGSAMLGNSGPETIDSAHVLKAEAGHFRVEGHETQFTIGRATTVTIVTAVRTNQVSLQLTAISLLSSLDAKIEQLRADRSNSEDPVLYQDLKNRVEAFLAAVSAMEEPPIAASSLSIADGLRGWWDRDHADICSKTFNMGLFAGGLSICAAAGVLGPIGVVTVGTLIAGKNLTGALEACAKLLTRDRSGGD